MKQNLWNETKPLKKRSLWKKQNLEYNVSFSAVAVSEMSKVHGEPASQPYSTYLDPKSSIGIWFENVEHYPRTFIHRFLIISIFI